MSVVAYISTRGRYDTTLPLAIASLAMQTMKPDKLVIFDDNDHPEELRDRQHYVQLFQLLDGRGIPWLFLYGAGKGQHHNHQLANKMGFDWAFRLDDDCIAEPDVLSKLMAVAISRERVGAVGGSILIPPGQDGVGSSRIDEMDKPNKQWFRVHDTEEVEHLNCSFLYRAGVVDYDTDLSSVAHREETLFTYRLNRAGYHNYITPCTTWHLRGSGGIRTRTNLDDYDHDDALFKEKLLLLGAATPETQYAVLNSGLGDHYAFLNILPELKRRGKVVIACCYPGVFPGEETMSIAAAELLLGDTSRYDIYRYMADRVWKTSLVEAYRSLYKLC